MTTLDPRPRVRPKPERPERSDPPVRMEHAEMSRFRRAAYAARRLYPGPMGELAERELLAWEEFGYRLGDRGLMRRLVDDIEKRTTEKENGS